MKQVLKKILANALVLVVMMLPLHAMAMPIDMSADHCMSSDMASEISAMQDESHPMPLIDDEQVLQSHCCKQSVGDCTSCAGMTAVTFGLLQFSENKKYEMFAVSTELLVTRITSPPSRPPQTLTI
jgi:hypothetical protein